MRRIAVLLTLAVLLACSREAPQPVPEAAPDWPRLDAFEPMRIPPDNPLTREKVDLGKRLFFDARLSADGATSCAGCHEPKYGYTIGAVGNRACPTLINAGYAKGFYWEGAPIP